MRALTCLLLFAACSAPPVMPDDPCANCTATQLCIAEQCIDSTPVMPVDGGMISSDAGPSDALRVFVTSATFTGAMGGLAGVDQRCATAVLAANKGGTWKAFITGPTTTAQERQADAGPWVQERDDGNAVMTLGSLVEAPFAVINFDEYGRSSNAPRTYWTGVDADGGIASDRCGEWSSTVGFNGAIGNGALGWFNTSSAVCSTNHGVLCFEQSHEPVAPSLPTTRKRLFVTSNRTNGNLGGPTGADVKCATAAQEANKAGLWRAFISEPLISAAQRQADVGPWYQEAADGGLRLTFNNKAGLSTTPLIPIVTDETGRVAADRTYWTGVESTSGIASERCGGWQSSTGVQGVVGNGSASGSAWASENTSFCSNTFALLCLEQ